MIAGIDIGTQSLKAVICDEQLAPLGEASRPYRYEAPRPGWAEQDPRLWEGALGPAIAGALERAGLEPGDVAAIGISGQLDGCVPVGAGGEPLGPCLIWMDRRAAEMVPAMDAARFREQTGLVADASHMAAKIRWLEAAGTRAHRYHQPVSYLVSRLTGVAVLDHGHASTTMVYDLAGRGWSEALCERFEIDPATLPAIAGAATVAGPLADFGARLSGLPAGIPVAVGTGDDFATPLGAGIVEPAILACVLGTAEVVGAVSTELILDDRGLLETHGYTGDRYFIENPGWLSGGALRWLGALLGGLDDRELDVLAASSEPGARGITFIPALTGAMAPVWAAAARGCFYGLAASTDRADLARAVYEGCAFAMNDVARRLAELGAAPSEIALLGGGSRSEVIGRIRADVSGLPAAPARYADTCPLGAAALAAVASGVARDLPAATATLAARGDRLEPDRAVADRYAEAYQRYLDLFDATRPLWTDRL